MAMSHQVSAKNKHIEVTFHHVRDLISQNRLKMEYISTIEQPADIPTESVRIYVVRKHLENLYIVTIEKEEVAKL